MFKNYLMVALRNLFRHKVYSAINILGLAIGMACCILVVLFIRYEFQYDRHHEKLDRIYRVLRNRRASSGDFYYSSGMHGALAGAIAAEYPEVEKGVEIFVRTMWVTHQDTGFDQWVCMADPGFLDVFTFPLAEGDRARFQDPYTVFMTRRAAQRFFGDADPIGQVIAIDYKWGIHADYTVAGILEDIPETTSAELYFDVLTSTVPPSWFKENIWDVWRPGSTLQAVKNFVLLREGASAEDLEDKLSDFLVRHLGEGADQDNAYHLMPWGRFHLYSLVDYGFGDRSTGDIGQVYAFALVGFFILLIACVNFMNLATARSAKRAREVGLRKAVGAHRRQLIRQFLGESMLLSVLALVLALVLATAALSRLNAFVHKTLSLWGEPSGILIGILLGITVFVGVVAGSYPAFYLSAFDPAAVLRGSSKTGTGRSWLRSVLVVLQFAISIVLIIGTLVAFRQSEYLRNKDLGFNKERLVLMDIFWENRSLMKNPGPVKAAFSRHANVLKASVIFNPPGLSNTTDMSMVRATGSEGPENKMFTQWVDEDFLETFQIPLVAGRGFTNRTEDRRAVMLNEAAARQLGLVAGQTVETWGETWPVIGVVKDYHHQSLYQPIAPLVLFHRMTCKYLAVRIHPQNIPETIAFLKAQWRQFVPDKPFEFYFADDFYAGFYQREMALRQVYGGFSLLAIFVACLGLLGLISYAAEQRTKEIGIRKALGASVSDLVMLLSKEFLVLVALSNLLAWPVAYYAMNRWLQGFVYRIDLDVATFMLGGVLALGIALGTVGAQAYKAARANPVVALRYE